jgi:2-octaprenyl-6-methoxyphenol hydroxylase
MAGDGRLTSHVIVVGAGPAGLVTAVALADAGIETLLLAKSPPSDNRTSALMHGSVAALEAIGIWQSCAVHAAPLRTLRIVDDTRRLWRAPEAHFEASEIGLDAFGYNIENRHLIAALLARAAALPTLRRIDDDAAEIVLDADRVSVRTSREEQATARLLIGADGRNSLSRAAAGIDIVVHSYPQTALTFNVVHSRPHHDISTEFHRPSGPFTLVPLPGLRSSIVCVVDRAEAEMLRDLSPRDLADELEQRSHSILGRIEPEASRGAFPLSAETARSFGARRVALVGDAAHRLPPIGAQGLNLGLRDAAAIAELVVHARRRSTDIGSDELLARYERMRRADVTSRLFAVDILNRTLLSGLLPFQAARGLGLFALNRIGPLRRAVMREGIAPSRGQPRLMRGKPIH